MGRYSPGLRAAAVRFLEECLQPAVGHRESVTCLEQQFEAWKSEERVRTGTFSNILAFWRSRHFVVRGSDGLVVFCDWRLLVKNSDDCKGLPQVRRIPQQQRCRMVLHANSHSDTDCSREEGDRDGSEDTVEGWEPALWTATGQRTKDILTASNFLRLWPDDFKDLVAEESERAQFWKLVPLDLASLIVTSCEARQLDPRLVEEVVMDLHRPIRIRLSSTAEETFVATAIVTEQHIADILRTAQPVLFRNRFGMNNTLHRISVMHSHLDETKVIGMTMRYGRPVPGCLALIPDVVLSGKSVLLVGKGGAGKTTCLREFARILSDFCKKRTMIVDTTNEIGGMGEAMHPSVGRLSRRMPVKNADHLHDYMLRAVENHSSQIILIDEISNRKQCMAASSIRDRGVQMIASAHGETLVSVLENPELSVLVGGAETVIFSDAEARENGMQSKVAQQRRARPVFDIIVEMRDRQHWVVHQDVRTAVDSLLSVDGCCIGEERTYGEYQQVLARPCTLHRR